MKLNKGIPTPAVIIIIVICAALVGGIVWQHKGIVTPGCTTDSDCEYLECPSRNKLYCTSVEFVGKRCVNGRCECKCVMPEYELPEPPSGDELTYQGKSYIKTEQKYNEYIPDKFQVELEQGGTIYVYNDNIYTLHAADPHHGAYTYIKWELKQQPEQEIDASSWKTYTNEKYGFEIKYPPQSKLEERTPEWIWIDVEANTRTTGPPGGTQFDDIFISVADSLEELDPDCYGDEQSLETWIDHQIEGSNCYRKYDDKKEITIGAEDYQAITVHELTGPNARPNDIFLTHNSSIFTISVYGVPKSPSEQYKILSTFRFID